MEEICLKVKRDFFSATIQRDRIMSDLDKVQAGKDPEVIRDLKKEMEILAGSIDGQRDFINPLEKMIHLRRQYESQVSILREAGLLSELKAGRLGFKGIDGQKYELPSFREVLDNIIQKREFLKTKAEQGFTKLLLVPFGLPLDVFF